jgi:hypothetical protein
MGWRDTGVIYTRRVYECTGNGVEISKPPRVPDRRARVGRVAQVAQRDIALGTNYCPCLFITLTVAVAHCSHQQPVGLALEHAHVLGVL